MSASLLSVVSTAYNICQSLDELDSLLPVSESLINKIKPEFQDDFRLLIERGPDRMPRVEFLAYWEKDENCREAVGEFLRPIIAKGQEMLDALRALAEWKP